MSNEKEYISCDIIEHGFDAQVDSVNLCCRITKEKITDKLVLIKNYRGEKVDWDKFFQIKDNLRNIQKAGETIPSCKGCIYLKNNKWSDEHYINTINLNNWIKCNADCIYCDRKQYSHLKEYKIFPMIDGLIKNNLLKMPADITIAGGEPTVTSDFDKTLNLLIKNNISTIRVLTNAIKYNKQIEKGLKTGLVNILVSVDSGTKETFKIIKRTDKFYDVWKNIKKYSKIQKINSLVKTKYIIIPGINDNKNEITEFMKNNYENGVKYTEIDIEIGWFYRFCNNLTALARIYELFIKAKETGRNYGIITNAFDRMKLTEEKISKNE